MLSTLNLTKACKIIFDSFFIRHLTKLAVDNSLDSQGQKMSQNLYLVQGYSTMIIERTINAFSRQPGQFSTDFQKLFFFDGE